MKADFDDSTHTAVINNDTHIIQVIKGNPLPIIEITPPESGQIISLGDTFAFEFTFSETSISASIPVSIMDRQGNHIHNVLVNVVDGVGVGSFTPDKAIDYFITDSGINFHHAIISNELRLSHEFYLRVAS
tara:strand:+ start:32868 stop:33260 length:393 start_codon:yes stop_codon:yes gene_type:complete